MEWLRKHLRGKRALSANQYEFQAGCSMIDMAEKLKKLTASAIKKRQFGAAVSLDIQKRIQCNTLDAHIGSAIEYKGAGRPLQYHPGLLTGPGGIFPNSIGPW